MEARSSDEITRLLQASINRESNRAKKEYNTIKDLALKNQQMAKKIVDLEAERNRLRAFHIVAVNYLETSVQSVENLLLTDPSLLDFESLAEYTQMARFLLAANGRPNMVEVAEKRMREMKA